MTDPVRTKAFVQQTGQGWKVFQYRDDVNQQQDYYELRTDGSLDYVSHLDYIAPKKANDPSGEWYLLNGQDSNPGLAGFGVAGGFSGSPQGPLGPMGPAGDTSALGRGNPNSGSALSPEVIAAFRQYAKSKLGLDGPLLDQNADVPDMVDLANQVKRGLLKDEDFDTALYKAMKAKASGADGLARAQTTFAGLYSAAQKAAVLTKVAGNLTAEDPANAPEWSSDPFPVSSKTGQVLNSQTGAKTDPKTGASTTPTLAAAASGGAGIGAGAGFPVPSTAGPGPGGAEVTSDLLKDYLESDFNLAFGAYVNSFKHAGGAANFLQFVQRQMQSYLSEYKGELASQALVGKVPTGDWTSFLSRKAVGNVGNIGGDPNADATKTYREELARQQAIDAARARSAAPATPVVSAAGTVKATPAADWIGAS